MLAATNIGENSTFDIFLEGLCAREIPVFST